MFDPFKPDEARTQLPHGGLSQAPHESPLREPFRVKARDNVFRWMAALYEPGLEQSINVWASELREQGPLPLLIKSWSGARLSGCEGPIRAHHLCGHV